MKKSTSISSTKMARTLAAATLFSAMMLPIATVPANANDIVAGTLHNLKCLGLLISDPAKHLQVCGVSGTKVVILDISKPTDHPVAPEEPESPPSEDYPPPPEPT